MTTDQNDEETDPRRQCDQITDPDNDPGKNMISNDDGETTNCLCLLY